MVSDCNPRSISRNTPGVSPRKPRLFFDKPNTFTTRWFIAPFASPMLSCADRLPSWKNEELCLGLRRVSCEPSK